MSQVDSSVEFAFRYNARDYVRAFQLHYGSRLRLRLDIAAIVVLGGLAVLLWQSPGTRWFGVACGVVAGLFGLMLIAAIVVVPYLTFRREPKFRDEYRLVFSPEGIDFHTEHIDSLLQWSMYSRALVDANSYLLYYGSRQFTLIPTRVFERPEQQQAFEELLTDHVPRIDRRPT